MYNVVFFDFEVASLALNYFTNARIKNVEVSTVYQKVPVIGVFTFAYILLSACTMR